MDNYYEILKKFAECQYQYPKNSSNYSSHIFKKLKDLRILCRNLVYIVGLPIHYSENEHLLKNFEYFGKYGNVLSVIINKKPATRERYKKKSCAVYVAFSSNSEALFAIKDIHNSWLNGNKIRASFGTTKYCSNFILRLNCTNKSCHFLHELGPIEDTFTVQELKNGSIHYFETVSKAVFNENIGLAPDDSLNSSLLGLTEQEVIKLYYQNSSLVEKILPDFANKHCLNKAKTLPIIDESNGQCLSPITPQLVGSKNNDKSNSLYFDASERVWYSPITNSTCSDSVGYDSRESLNECSHLEIELFFPENLIIHPSLRQLFADDSRFYASGSFDNSLSHPIKFKVHDYQDLNKKFTRTIFGNSKKKNNVILLNSNLVSDII